MSANTISDECENFVQIDSIRKIFSGRNGRADREALNDITVTLSRGEFLSIMGARGCGKSTLLNIVAGLEQPTSGYVLVDGKMVTAPALDRGLLFQNHSLLPWLSVLNNVELAVQTVFPEKSWIEVNLCALQYLELAGMRTHLNKKPAEISAGMKQRVGLARAFATQPSVLLMDEPFGGLDAFTRTQLQDDLMTVWESDPRTVVLATNDVDEAIFLSDRIVLMSDSPARIADVIEVNLPRPRSREESMRYPEFQSLRESILHHLTHADQHQTVA